MRLDEIIRLTESVTFGVSKLENHNGEKRYRDSFSTKQEKDCEACDGTGKDEYSRIGDGKCEYCTGTGKYLGWKTPYKELNVANANASAILDMLGLNNNDELFGAIETKDLPLIRRKLIAIKNKDKSPWNKLPSMDQSMRRTVDDNGLTKIEPGVRIYHGGRSIEQIDRYIDALLYLIDFAQKNDGVITWS